MKKNTMNRREFLKKSGITSGAILLSSSYSCSKKKRPNIIFIFSDDHAYQAISAYGSRLAEVAATPNIDRLAKEGMLFTRCCVTNSICAPSRATILTGKHSHLNGVRDNRDKFDGNQQTFPKLLGNAGYQTAIIGKWHLKSKPTGFDYWDVLRGQGNYYNPDFLSMEGEKREHGYVTDIITDKALNWMKDTTNSEQPFMLMVQHKAPHREWEPGPKQLTLYDDTFIPEPENLFDDYHTRGTAAKKQDMSIEKTMKLDSDLKVREAGQKDRAWDRTMGRMDEKQRQEWEAAYQSKNENFKAAKLKGKELVRWKYQRYMKDYLRCIKSVDDNVGRLLDYLDRTGLSKNTVVMYSSDQGFYLGEHGWFDKRFMYEESFRTPFLVRWPDVTPPGSVNQELVSNLDFAQTFLDISGVIPPTDMQGISLKPLLEGNVPGNWRKSLYYHYYEYPAVHSVRRHEGVATKKYKLIHFYDLDEWELYDLEKDSHEMQNRYNHPDYLSIVADLKQELIKLKKRYQVPEK
jgi:arylsulfatase A-like enzyme